MSKPQHILNPLEQEYMNTLHDKMIRYCKGKILDFGCGNSNFKEKYDYWNITNYDKDPKLTEVRNYTHLRIDTITACHVFEHIELPELDKHIKNFKKMKVNLVVSLPTENRLSRFLQFLLNRTKNGHVTTLEQVNELLSKYFRCISKERILFGLTEISIWIKE